MSLSSWESELCAAVSTGVEALGLQSGLREGPRSVGCGEDSNTSRSSWSAREAAAVQLHPGALS